VIGTTLRILAPALVIAFMAAAQLGYLPSVTPGKDTNGDCPADGACRGLRPFIGDLSGFDLH
jgi:hypothetical protein